MYTLFRMLPASRVVREQLPALLLSLLVAEAFYKFHSFVLECLGFLATWFVVDWVFSLAARWLQRRTQAKAPPQ